MRKSFRYYYENGRAKIKAIIFCGGGGFLDTTIPINLGF